MFDIGWSELAIIGIVALIVIGPKELPTVLRTIGQYMGKVRRMASEFQGQFQEAMREAEVADLKKQADDLSSTVSSYTNFDPMADVQKSMEAAIAPEPGESTVAQEPAPAAEAANPPPIDVPLPEPLPPVTNEDFAPAEPSTQMAGDEPPPPKQAGSGG
ncbi:MAG: Sec-independent protein translocase protein TatB [Pseudolabrys sp.]